jgi:hypothetical protein
MTETEISELIAFNPILANALSQFVKRNHPEWEVMRQIVAASVKVGAEPEKIYAVIKTGRMLTTKNMQFLSKDDIREWADAAEEYRRLAGQD